MRAVLVLLAVAFADYVWARYIQACADRRTWLAAICSSVIVLLGGFTTLSLVDDPRYLVPAALGAYVGTVVAVRR